MKILKSFKNDILIFSIEGNLDAITSSEVNKELTDNINSENKKLVINMEKLEYISSAGLQIILQTAKKISNLDGFFALTNMNENVFEVFELSGFTSFLNIYKNVDDAISNINNNIV